MRIIPSAALLLLWMASRPSFVGAQNAAELLEKGIYAEETQGDLPAAIEIYKRITAVADAERPTVAQALLRLGNRYLKSERKTDATAAFDRLTREHPDETSLLSKIPPRPNQLELLDAPWKDQEETLVLRRPDPEDGRFFLGQAGLLVLNAREETVDGKSTALLENNWLTMRTTMRLHADTLRPIERILHGANMPFERWNATFNRNTIKLTHHRRDKSSTYDLQHATAYEFDELFALPRCLPLAESYETKVPVLAGTRPEVHEATIRVVGRETLTVPAGTFEAFKVAITLDDTFLADRYWHGAGRRTVWYSADSRRYPIKVEQGPQTWELAQVRVGPSAAYSVRAELATMSLDAPPGWLIIAGNTPAIPLLIAGRNAKVSGFLRHEPQTSPPKTSAQMSTERLSPSHVLREGPEDATLNGLSATRVVANYPITSGETRVEHAFYIARPDERLTLYFFGMTPDAWPSLEADIDAIAHSLRLD